MEATTPLVCRGHIDLWIIKIETLSYLHTREAFLLEVFLWRLCTIKNYHAISTYTEMSQKSTRAQLFGFSQLWGAKIGTWKNWHRFLFLCTKLANNWSVLYWTRRPPTTVAASHCSNGLGWLVYALLLGGRHQGTRGTTPTAMVEKCVWRSFC